MYRIMMIEDDEKIRRIVANTLKKWQYDVVEVTQFDQVLTEFEQTNPHLVLLDINLPVFDGYYWCQQVRAISKVPIIFLSSRNQNMDIIMAINMGGDDFIQKPFDLDILVAKISALIRRKYTYLVKTIASSPSTSTFLPTSRKSTIAFNCDSGKR